MCSLSEWTEDAMDLGVEQFGLGGRTALVTGAGRGVGAGIARVLAAAGASVAVNDLHADRAESVAETITEAGGQAVACPFDVTNVDATADALARTTEQVGDIDILVHNAGVPDGGGRPNKFVDMPPADWQLQIDLNLAATMRIVQAVLPRQIENGWGRIVQISSGASSRGLPIGVGAYGAAKAGSEALIRHLGVECGPHGVTANALALGLMEGLGRADDPAVQKMIRGIPIGRLGTGADVGAAILWLCSEAGGLVNAQVIHLNGGTVFGR
ncbi:SDR family NAD(P)-dependent oxidoreductase [Prescottella equi]|uniref:3-oxoacyl-[acyl-carrier-protein] reductase MabA n=1 Tax=Rhodococcus hoagii TaxID=43767 RepID=A0A9Q2UID2_RHOHA|nr:SDR family NAD(P)-dependent oxidoreductase [Prescottella equi]AVP67114.1 SDR family NAD(P)-dependent oxidoreductase [Prescottella equi]MBM4481047.1 SDR family oxidoreductase [Prescottella equi]MBM4482844.1 SDR family oxidoreductase [Prescottella equi]MBM4489788.1 SDR family oxidoreductase [Prescottella equi]MBM4496390.1 SDR family oxidoreductase [Prescottella equi]